MAVTEHRKSARDTGVGRTAKDIAALLRQDAVDWDLVAEKFKVIGTKLQQYLALRPDVVLDEPTVDRFLRASETRAMEIPFEEIEKEILSGLGIDHISDRFTRIERKPRGVASIAQVHLAEIRAGERVAIKIKRRKIEQAITDDIAVLRTLANKSIELSGIKTGAMVDEIEAWLERECDFEQEARNIEAFADMLAGSRSQVVPHVYPELCSKNIITMEYLEGVSLSTIIGMREGGRMAETGALGIDVDRIAAALTEATLEQIFLHQRFHADLHPGNLIALPGNRLGFVDFGLVDILDARFGRGMHRYLQAIYAGDVDGMLSGLRGLLLTTENADWEAFKNLFIEANHEWRRGERNNGHSLTGNYIQAVLTNARNTGHEIPRAILSMLRALYASDRVAHMISSEPGRDELRRKSTEFFEKHRWRPIANLLDPATLESEFVDYADIVREGPKKAYRVLSELVDGHFSINVENTESVQTRRQSDARAQLIGFGIAAVSLSMIVAGLIIGAMYALAVVVAVLLIYCYYEMYSIVRRMQKGWRD